jgi:GT2 family glycosyltransferase
VIVRGAVINTELRRLPPPIWTLANYSGNYFWTSNVSLRRARLDRVGGRFDESFAEYGWEDIELGMRLRELGTRGGVQPRAVAFHYKPRPAGRTSRDAAPSARASPHGRAARAQTSALARRAGDRRYAAAALAGERVRAQRYRGDARTASRGRGTTAHSTPRVRRAARLARDATRTTTSSPRQARKHR